MICQTCGRCANISMKGDTYSIGCLEKGGFEINQFYVDNFKCNDYAEKVEKEPVKDNICITLKCGRDIIITDDTIKNEDELRERIKCDESWVKVGDLMIRSSEIVIYSYIGG